MFTSTILRKLGYALLIVLAVLLCILSIFCGRGSYAPCRAFSDFVSPPSDAYTQLSTPISGFKTGQLMINDISYTVYIADTDATRTQGLSGITSMDSNEGVLFVFDSPTRASFWMKDMKFALDFVYIRDGVIVDLIQGVSPDTFPELITAKTPFTHVLELNAGQIKQWKFAVNDAVELH
jgi:uncharacterized membrane protein (UPF0127 family)